MKRERINETHSITTRLADAAADQKVTWDVGYPHLSQYRGWVDGWSTSML